MPPIQYRCITFWCVIGGLLFLAGCSQQLPLLPAFDSDAIKKPGKVVWHDLVTPDIEGAKAFYNGLFGWTFEDRTDGYSLVRSNGRYIAGIARLDLKERASHWLPLVSVEDMGKAVEQTAVTGGMIKLKPFDLPERGRVAVVQDDQGAAFGIIDSSAGDPRDIEPELNSWLWDEIWVADIERALVFYQGLTPVYTRKTRQIDDGEYVYLSDGRRPRVGLLSPPSREIGATWVAYIGVADVKASTDLARQLGGTVLMAPRQDVRNGSVAIIADPDGAGFILQEWSK